MSGGAGLLWFLTIEEEVAGIAFHLARSGNINCRESVLWPLGTTYSGGAEGTFLKSGFEG